MSSEEEEEEGRVVVRGWGARRGKVGMAFLCHNVPVGERGQVPAARGDNGVLVTQGECPVCSCWCACARVGVLVHRDGAAGNGSPGKHLQIDVILGNSKNKPPFKKQ